MKVAHVITRMIVGGAQENTLDTLRGLQHLGGYDITLITGPERGPEGNLLELKPVSGLRVLTIDSLRRGISPLLDISAYRSLCRLFRLERFDLVHTHSSKAGILGRWAAHHAGVPRVVHTIHGFAVGPYQSAWRNFIFERLERRAAHKTDLLIGVSENLLQEARRMGLNAKLMQCVPSGFDVRAFESATVRRDATRVSLGIDAQAVLAVKVARFFPLKGHDLVFGAMPDLLRRHPSLHFLFVGGGPLLEGYQKLVLENGWQARVHFTGLVRPQEVPPYMGAGDMLLHMSEREGLARSIPQAFACGLPVLSLDIPGAADLVKPGETGFLLHPQNAKPQMLEGMDALLKDPALRRRMGKAGHALIQERYGLDRMVETLDQCYRSL